MQSEIERVENALNELKNGKMIILTDHPDRENEGDLIVAAEKVTSENMNFMIRNGSGIVCLSMTAEKLRQLELPLMLAAHENSSFRCTPFTLSIDANDGITTGVSSADRAQTILAAINDHAKSDDLVKPGHIFPLQAKDNGVLERQGHTEGALDLAKLAGFKPAAVLCEIMNPDGTMTRGSQLDVFAKSHQLTMLSIDDVITYRLARENMIEAQASTIIPLENYGEFTMTVVKDKLTGEEHLVLKKEIANSILPTLVRVHSSCATGDIFSSLRCDCNKQLHHALQRISEEGGMLIYLKQEGRGIGLLNKIKAYVLQDNGADTVEANEMLGFPADARQYHIAANILRNDSIKHIRLMTNNLMKIQNLKKYGVENIIREEMPAFDNPHNQHYLKTKKDKLQHVINI